jgi:hypothetical protein
MDNEKGLFNSLEILSNQYASFVSRGRYNDAKQVAETRYALAFERYDELNMRRRALRKDRLSKLVNSRKIRGLDERISRVKKILDACDLSSGLLFKMQDARSQKNQKGGSE